MSGVNGHVMTEKCHKFFIKSPCLFCRKYFINRGSMVCVKLVCPLFFLVPRIGDFGVLERLEIFVCCEVSEVRRFPRQPETWHVSVPGATGHALCRGENLK